MFKIGGVELFIADVIHQGFKLMDVFPLFQATLAVSFLVLNLCSFCNLALTTCWMFISSPSIIPCALIFFFFSDIYYNYFTRFKEISGVLRLKCRNVSGSTTFGCWWEASLEFWHSTYGKFTELHPFLLHERKGLYYKWELWWTCGPCLLCSNWKAFQRHILGGTFIF